MGLAGPAQTPKVRLAQELRSRTVLADAPALVNYGLLIHVSHPALAEAVIADLHKTVCKLIGFKELYELLLHYLVAAGQINGSGLAQHAHGILGRKKLLSFLSFLHQKFKSPRTLGHILQPQISLKKRLAAALGQ